MKYEEIKQSLDTFKFGYVNGQKVIVYKNRIYGINSNLIFLTNHSIWNVKFLIDPKEIFSQFVNVKISSYIHSASVFGFKNIKKSMYDSNMTFKINKVYENYILEDFIGSFTIYDIFNGEKNYKFFESDLSFELCFNYKNLLKNHNSFKLYKLKSKNDLTNRKVKFVRTNKLSIDKNTTGEILKAYNLHNCNTNNGIDKNTRIIVKTNNQLITCRIKNIKIIK